MEDLKILLAQGITVENHPDFVQYIRTINCLGNEQSNPKIKEYAQEIYSCFIHVRQPSALSYSSLKLIRAGWQRQGKVQSAGGKNRHPLYEVDFAQGHGMRDGYVTNTCQAVECAQHLQQQQQTQNPNIATTGGQVVQKPAQQPSQDTTQPSLGPDVNASATLPQATQGNLAFTLDQLRILKHQIIAFKCLSRNFSIPQPTRQLIFGHQQEKLSPGDQLKPAAR